MFRVSVAAVICWCLVADGAFGQSDREKPPNIVLIMADDNGFPAPARL